MVDEATLRIELAAVCRTARSRSRVTARDLLLLDVDDPEVMEWSGAPDPSAWAIHEAIHAEGRRLAAVMQDRPVLVTGDHSGTDDHAGDVGADTRLEYHEEPDGVIWARRTGGTVPRAVGVGESARLRHERRPRRHSLVGPPWKSAARFSRTAAMPSSASGPWNPKNS